MAGRITIKAVNDELARLGDQARLEKASGYFYFWTGEASGWIDATVPVEKISALTLAEWIAEFKRLKKLNAELKGLGKEPAKAAVGSKRKQP
jgi:hypothetical protein